MYIFTKYLTYVGAMEVVHAYESVTCTNQQFLAPFVPKSSVSYKDVSTIFKLIDKRSPNWSRHMYVLGQFIRNKIFAPQERIRDLITVCLTLGVFTQNLSVQIKELAFLFSGFEEIIFSCYDYNFVYKKKIFIN